MDANMDIAHKPMYYSGLNALRLEWAPEISLRYGVRITFDKEEKSNEVKYEVGITRLKPGTEGQALFMIERVTDVYVNETLPDLIADRLAYEAGKVFYPLVISVDHNGGFDSIYNHNEIVKRWATVKDKIHDNFEGSMVEQYIEKMDKQLSDPNSIQMALFGNDWLINTFFKPIYKEYGTNLETQSTYKFPVAKSFDVNGYATTEKLSSSTNDFGAIDLRHDGILVPFEDELYISNRTTGNYEGYYVLHPKYKRIIAVVSTFTSGTHSHVKVNITQIPGNDHEFDYDFEPDSNIKGLPVEKMVVIDGHSSKKGFWQRLLNS